MALAHHLITVVYCLLSRNQDYVELGADFHDRRNKPKVVSRLVGRLQKLGYYVDLRAAEPLLPQSVTSGQAVTKRRRGRPCKCAERNIICKHHGAITTDPLIS